MFQMSCRIIWLQSPKNEIGSIVASTVNHAIDYIMLPDVIRFSVLKEHKNWGCTVLGGRFNGTIGLSLHLSTRETVRVLCHELMHLNQIFRGDLVGLSNGDVKWRGQLFQNVEILDSRTHRTLPWEIEAYDKQDWLLAMILQTVKK